MTKSNGHNPLTWRNESRRLGDLIPWEHNPRQIKEPQAERLVDSVATFGQVETLAIGPDNGIYNGHQRLHALMQKFGPDYEVDVRISSRPLTHDEQRKLTIYLHEGATGEWDFDILPNLYEVEELIEWGFPEWKLEGVDFGDDNAGEPQDAEPQINRAEELREEWGTETGQLWILPSRDGKGCHKLICGDCTDAAVVERVLQGERVAAVSDPPYGINVDTSWLSALNVKRGKPANMSDDKLANDDGSLDISWIYKHPEWLVFGFPYLARNESYTGLLVWDKRGDGGENGIGNPVEVAASNAFNGYRLARHVWAGYVRETGEKREPHPTQKPVGIMSDAISLVKSLVIFDPFVGSGTTMIACENLERQCRMVEISPAYCAVTLERYKMAFGVEPHRAD